MQRTLIFLKPDVYENKIIGKVIDEIEQQKGFSIVNMKMFRLNEKEAKDFYSVHKDKPFYSDLSDYICRGPIIAMVIEGEGVISMMRELMGNTDPTKAEKNTIRGKYGSSLDSNVLHGSDSKESAEKEIPFFFSKRELL